MLTPPVAVYLASVVALQLLTPAVFRGYEAWIGVRRRRAGLPADRLTGAAEELAYLRVQAITQSLVFLGSVLLIPLLLVRFWPSEDPKFEQGLAFSFAALVLWFLVNGSDVARSLVGGLFFKTLVSHIKPIQVGDRVTLRGHSGKVTSIGVFFVRLQTLDDDLVSIPCDSLWSEVLVSANAGDRSSLCVMNFYLAPFASGPQRQSAEDAIWESLQASPYCDTAKPMQIYLTQEVDAICLSAKSYVASTYKEGVFRSDVTRAFLEVADSQNIPLASSQWRTDTRPSS
jgi:hypothetical protein